MSIYLISYAVFNYVHFYFQIFGNKKNLYFLEFYFSFRNIKRTIYNILKIILFNFVELLTYCCRYLHLELYT